MPSSQFTVLAPTSPSGLLSHTISQYRWPTTLIIGCSKSEFQTALTQEITHQLASQDLDIETTQPSHSLLKASLHQIAVSRHIRILFTPTVTHLRSQLSVFSSDDAPIPPPPNHDPDAHQPVLVVYGLLELHRDASEWSAQGVGNSAALLADAAARNAFRAVIIEPISPGDLGGVEHLVGEMLPLLNGTLRKADGTWSGRTVSVRQVLSRWFTFENPRKETRF